MTPNFAVIGIQTPHWRGRRLWLPLFLLWIPVVLLSPLIFLVAVGIWLAVRIAPGIPLACRVSPWRTIAVLWGILCSLPGTHVRVSTQDTQILVRIL
ncbi:MAG: hypothetical protein ABSE99_04985 [Terracidiphilus sp.]|jgi:hypothetical protein